MGGGEGERARALRENAGHTPEQFLPVSCVLLRIYVSFYILWFPSGFQLCRSDFKIFFLMVSQDSI